MRRAYHGKSTVSKSLPKSYPQTTDTEKRTSLSTTAARISSSAFFRLSSNSYEEARKSSSLLTLYPHSTTSPRTSCPHCSNVPRKHVEVYSNLLYTAMKDKV